MGYFAHVERISLFGWGVLLAVSSLLVANVTVLPVSVAQASTTAAESCGSGESPTFSGGSGTLADPFLISSSGNLETLANCVLTSSSANQTTYNSSSVHYLQTADLDLGGATFEIGYQATSAKPFKANYDGGNYAVHNFESPYGLFAEGAGGTSDGCVIENLVVSGSATSGIASAEIGLVLGNARGCTVDNVTAYGTVASGSSSQTLGGLVGFGQTYNRATVITNSRSHVDITVGSVVSAGGIVGDLRGGTLSNSSSTRVADPWDSNTLRGSITTSVSQTKVGGAAGYISDTNVSNVSSTVTITGTTAASCSTCLAIGGLVGEAQASTSPAPVSITNSYATGSITLARLDSNQVGGLVGRLDIPVSSSYSTSTITFRIEDSQLVLGGLVGRSESDGDISESYYSGTLTGTNDTFAGASRIGGLVGHASGDVSESYAIVTLSGLDSSDAGGLVGRQESTATISDSFVAGTLTAATSSNSEIAGLVLQNYAGTISRSYSFADVSDFGSAGYPITDYNTGTHTAVYWNSDQSGVASSSYGAELTAAQFIDSSNFTGWDFSSTWTMGTCAPYLTWIGSSPTGLCPAVAPSAPTLTGVTAGDSQLTVAFTAGSDGGVAITNYKYSTDGSTYTALSPADAASPITITGLTNGTSYSVTLKAVNSVGDSSASNSLSGTPVAPSTPSPSPSPSPEPSPAPVPVPEPAPTPSPAATPTPPAEPPVVNPPPSPSTPPAPAAPPATTPQPPATSPAGPGAVVLRSEELFEGVITLGNDTEEVIMPAFVLEDIAKHIAPDGAPLEEGALVIESGVTMIAVLIIQLGDVRLAAADMGDYIQFTLNVPGFESTSMSVAVEKQTLVWALWVQLGLFAVSAVIAAIMLWWFIALRRRRKRDEEGRSRSLRQASPVPPIQSSGALGI